MSIVVCWPRALGTLCRQPRCWHAQTRVARGTNSAVVLAAIITASVTTRLTAATSIEAAHLSTARIPAASSVIATVLARFVALAAAFKSGPHIPTTTTCTAILTVVTIIVAATTTKTTISTAIHMSATTAALNVAVVDTASVVFPLTVKALILVPPAGAATPVATCRLVARMLGRGCVGTRRV